MEAKDTVIQSFDCEQGSIALSITELAIVEVQAETSFKAGKEVRLNDVISYLEYMAWVFGKEQLEFIGIIQELKSGVWVDVLKVNGMEETEQ